ncbi:MAG TPA: GyrI-like domain-containing protein, partial [Deinococcales bacterium]|nr:GyrI-like domain-containing protein [Deinococcales bacterium]
IGEQVSGLYARLFAALDAAGLRPAGPAFIAYPEEDFNPEAFILDVGVPVPPPRSLAQAALKGSGAFAGLFKPCRAAVARVVGPYSTLTAAHAAVFAWLQERGLTATSAPREVYLIGPGMAEEAAFVTELVYPIGTPPPGR